MADKLETPAVVAGGKKPNVLLPVVKRVAIGVVALVVLAAILFFVPATKPFINRFLGIATPQTSGPCSGDKQLIASHNNIMKTDGVVGIADEVKQVRAKSDYASDPSCVYISMLGYYSTNAVQNALDEHKVLDRLKIEGKLPAAAINDGVDVGQVVKTLERAANDKPENPYAQG